MGRADHFVVIFCIGIAACSPELSSDDAGEDGGDGSGDGDGDGDDSGDGGDGDVGPTWHQDIHPLVAANCQGCHSEGGIAPFSLQSYETAQMFADLMGEMVGARLMPPWHAEETDECTYRFPFADDLRLTDDEIDLVLAWVDAGAPEGDPENKADLPNPPNLDIEDPDISLTIPIDVAIEDGADQYRCFSFDPGIDQETFISEFQVIPGNTEIVHHVLVYSDPNGESANFEQGYSCFGGAGISSAALVGGWVPGSLPVRLPPGTAQVLMPDGLLVMQVHYHPTGGPTEWDDGTTIEMKQFDGLPHHVAAFTLLGNFGFPPELLPGDGDENGVEFRIPAGATDHVETMEYVVPADIFPPELEIEEARVLATGAHMHFVGTDMKIDIERVAPSADQPADECLLHVPDWSFHWQRAYFYDADLDELPTVAIGDTVHLRCTYDNSLGNPYVVDALDEQDLEDPIDVYLGEATLDEMCLGIFGVAAKLPVLP
jgi:hypothetical protein